MHHEMSPERFLEMSADISYRLSGRAFDPRTLLDLILEDAVACPCSESILIHAIAVVVAGYGDSRRRMGPLAAIHPLRVAAILSRVTRDPTVMDLLAALLHDRDEDLTRDEIGEERWTEMQAKMSALVQNLDERHCWYLGERLDILTLREGQDYCQYLANLMGHAGRMPDLIRVKLADRLDNTLDVGVSHHGIPSMGVFGTVFDLLFLPDFQGIPAPDSYVPITEEEGVQMLANLFKNSAFLSLLRSEHCQMEGTTRRLYNTLVRASTRIAQYLVQDTFATAVDIDEQRAITQKVLDYCRSGGLTAVRPGKDHSLDGMFLEIYGSKKGRRDRLKALFADKSHLGAVALVFVAVFSNFLANPAYTIQGISATGVRES